MRIFNNLGLYTCIKSSIELLEGLSDAEPSIFYFFKYHLAVLQKIEMAASQYTECRGQIVFMF